MSTINSTINHKTLDLEDYSIHYYVSGESNKETILMLHPAFSDHRAFDLQIDFFAKNYKVITIDMIGHGLSKSNKSKDRIDATVSHIDDIFKLEKVDKAHFIGVSMGSLVAQYYGQHHPENVKSLISMGGHYINKDDKEIRTKQRNSNLGLVVKAMFSMEAFRKGVAQVTCHTENGKGHFYTTTSEYERKSFMSMQGFQHIIKDREIAPAPYPTLIAVGQNDIELAIRMNKQWHDDVSNTEHILINKAGHCANIDCPEAFNTIALDFIQKQ